MTVTLSPSWDVRNLYSSSVVSVITSSYFSNNAWTLLATSPDLTKSFIFWPPPSACLIPRSLDISTPEPNCFSISSLSSWRKELGNPFKNKPRVFTSIKSKVLLINMSKKSSKDTPLARHSIALPATLDMPQRPIAEIISDISMSVFLFFIVPMYVFSKSAITSLAASIASWKWGEFWIWLPNDPPSNLSNFIADKSFAKFIASLLLEIVFLKLGRDSRGVIVTWYPIMIKS